MTAALAPAEPAPLTLEHGVALLQRFARLSARAATIEAEHQVKIAPIKAAADKKLAPIAAELDELKAELEPWWKIHAADLTKGKRKSHELAGCVIGSRLGSKSLKFSGGDDQAAVAALLKGRFVKLIRRVLSPDKKLIVARLEEEPEGAIALLGFSTEQADTFFVEPAARTGRKS